MATRIHIPSFLIGNREDFDINDFVAGQGFTVLSRTRTGSEWLIDIEEDLNVGQQTALSQQLRNNLDAITFEALP